MRILIAGSSGFIGSALRAALGASGHELRRLVRRPASASDEVSWEPTDGSLDPQALEGVDAVINLAGAGIGDARWTESRKKLLYDSRIGTTTLLSETMAAQSAPPAVFLTASAIGIYGDRQDEILVETSEPGPDTDFLASLTRDWEAAAAPAADAGVRVVALRTGLVLDPQDQLLARLLPIFKLGLGGRLGSGAQWWSWITLEDEIRAIVHLLEQEVAGPVNLTAPNPVTNAEFTEILGEELRRPTRFMVPRIALKTVLGPERGEALGFTSARVLPERLVASGFEFVHPELRGALRAILGG